MPRVLKKTPGQLHAIDDSSLLKFLILRGISAFPVPCFARWPCFCIVIGWFRFFKKDQKIRNNLNPRRCKVNTRKPAIGLFVLLFCVLVVTAGCGKKFIRGASESSESVDGSIGTFAQESGDERYGDGDDTNILSESLDPLGNVLSSEEATNSDYASAFSDDERAGTTEETGTHATAFGSAADDSRNGNAGDGTNEQGDSEKGVSFSHGLQDVYFAFNSWRLSEKARLALEANAEWIKSHPHERLTIEGHCDERGTRAYNYVLGEKRATRVKQYLSALGVPSHQMMVASFGKDRPTCHVFSEKCFQSNRRAHFDMDVNVAAR